MDKIIKKLSEIEDSEDTSYENRLSWQLEDMVEKIKKNSILDIMDFKRELERANLMNPKLEEFIEIYMRWDNVWRY